MKRIDPDTLLQTGLVTQSARGRTAVRSCLCRVTSGDRVVEEITEEIMVHPRSVCFDEAENRLHAQKAVLLHLLGKA